MLIHDFALWFDEVQKGSNGCDDTECSTSIFRFSRADNSENSNFDLNVDKSQNAFEKRISILKTESDWRFAKLSRYMYVYDFEDHNLEFVYRKPHKSGHLASFN